MKFPLLRLAGCLVLSSCRSCLGIHTAEIFWVQHPCHVEKILLGSSYPGPLALTLSSVSNFKEASDSEAGNSGSLHTCKLVQFA